jgi:ferric-dicitrate binding protein FerR (iron transport regulator)
MTLHATREELELYVLGAVDGGRAEALEAHCAACDACAAALAREAQLEIAFEQVARVAARPAVLARPLRAAAYGAAGVVAMAAAAVLWFGRGPLTTGEGTSSASGGQASTEDGAILDGRDDVLDGG